MHKDIRIRALYPNYYGDGLIAGVALRIVKYFNDEHIESDIMGVSSEKSMLPYKKKIKIQSSVNPDVFNSRRIYKDAIPAGVVWSVVRRVFSVSQARRFAEAMFFSSLKKYDIIYLWPGCSKKLYEKLKKNGYVVITERINTLISTSKKILDNEYQAFGIPSTHGLTKADVDMELECLNLSDFIFSPSPGVTRSILNVGIPKVKILESSYGLDKHEILNQPDGVESSQITAIFVGSICIRKGVHLLIKAWERAQVNAKLLLVGRISKELKDIVESAIQNKMNIFHVDFVSDLKPIYRDSDFFILPSLEEGSPLVTYLALGAGLPCLVSTMGSGGVIEDGRDGIIIDPHDLSMFSNAIRELSVNTEKRFEMGKNAYQKALDYTWEKVALKRKEAILHALNLECE